MSKEPRIIYSSKWDRERLTFLHAYPLCVMCHEQGRVAAATVVDHIVPHKLFVSHFYLRVYSLSAVSNIRG